MAPLVYTAPLWHYNGGTIEVKERFCVDKLLDLLKTNARLTSEELAALLDTTPEDVEERIAAYEREGIVRGFTAAINHEKAQDQYVEALIELKVTPKKGHGFDEIAMTIMRFPEVSGVKLMSGGFDLAVTLQGDSFQQIAMFVAEKLAPLESVVSTATHFMLRNYKEGGIAIVDEQPDERRVTWL